MNSTGKIQRVLWQELPSEVREALTGKLKGLYGAERDESAFESLAIDKQQALLLLSGRLRQLDLWDFVRRVENIYGLGGVGMNFTAWPGLAAELQRRKEFTRRFARHSDVSGGFLERGPRQASLHFLYQDVDAGRKWGAHFDLYSPWSSPGSAWRHLLYEKLRGVTPDWRAIQSALSRLS